MKNNPVNAPRRRFSGYLGCLLLSAALPRVGMANSPSSYASASVDDRGQHWLIVFDQLANQQIKYPLPSRAHQVLKHPTQPWLLVVARRPGQYLLVIDLNTGALVQHITASAGQHFCGHMQISADGRFLYTTENLTRNSAGLIVVRDFFEQLQTLQQFSSGGIGPHQLKLCDAGKTLVVANGGIHTKNRQKLNLQQMHSNLSYINLATSEITEQVMLDAEYAQLSIRHIAVDDSSRVLIAMQYQGERTALVPLVALHQRGEPLDYLAIPETDFFQLQQYCGSACFDRTGSVVAVSAPKGDSILFWDLANNNRYLHKIKVKDGCGITAGASEGEFIVSSGRGRVYQINPRQASKTLLLKNTAIQWDNHLAAVG